MTRWTNEEWEEYERSAEIAKLKREVGMLDVSRCTVCGTVAPAGTKCSEPGCTGEHPWWEDQQQT